MRNTEKKKKAYGFRILLFYWWHPGSEVVNEASFKMAPIAASVNNYLNMITNGGHIIPMMCFWRHGFKVQDYFIISSVKSKRGWTLTT